MPTLNNISTPPQSRIVSRAKVHLVIWYILFFFLALVIVVGAIADFVIAVPDLHGKHWLSDLPFRFAFFGALAGITIKLAFYCLRARSGLDRKDPSHLKPVVISLTILSSLGLYAAAVLGLVLISKRDVIPVFQNIGTLTAIVGGILLLTALAFWTKRSLWAALKSFQTPSPNKNAPPSFTSPPPPQ